MENNNNDPVTQFNGYKCDLEIEVITSWDMSLMDSVIYLGTKSRHKDSLFEILSNSQLSMIKVNSVKDISIVEPTPGMKFENKRKNIYTGRVNIFMKLYYWVEKLSNPYKSIMQVTLGGLAGVAIIYPLLAIVFYLEISLIDKIAKFNLADNMVLTLVTLWFFLFVQYTILRLFKFLRKKKFYFKFLTYVLTKFNKFSEYLLFKKISKYNIGSEIVTTNAKMGVSVYTIFSLLAESRSEQVANYLSSGEFDFKELSNFGAVFDIHPKTLTKITSESMSSAKGVNFLPFYWRRHVVNTNIVSYIAGIVGTVIIPLQLMSLILSTILYPWVN